jgi:hypothetical protein
VLEDANKEILGGVARIWGGTRESVCADDREKGFVEIIVCEGTLNVRSRAIAPNGFKSRTRLCITEENHGGVNRENGSSMGIVELLRPLLVEMEEHTHKCHRHYTHVFGILKLLIRA